MPLFFCYNTSEERRGFAPGLRVVSVVDNLDPRVRYANTFFRVVVCVDATGESSKSQVDASAEKAASFHSLILRYLEHLAVIEQSPEIR